MKVPRKPGCSLVFFVSYSPRYQKPPRSFALAIFTIDFTFTSGVPGPVAPAAMVVSHFQLPSYDLKSASSSGGGVVGSAAAAGAGAPAFAGAAGAALAGFAAG